MFNVKHFTDMSYNVNLHTKKFLVLGVLDGEILFSEKFGGKEKGPCSSNCLKMGYKNRNTLQIYCLLSHKISASFRDVIGW